MFTPFGNFVLVLVGLYLSHLLFFQVGVLPLAWRLGANPVSAGWDWLCCTMGLHRCVYTCNRGCCSECIRCHPQSIILSLRGNGTFVFTAKRTIDRVKEAA